ncbi:MAG TPA: hypothetical protein VGT60_12550 [Candidatus Limnocylindria bacterium]|nr:hypothetical protein [Candidatus Limnocylindria bacterium]
MLAQLEERDDIVTAEVDRRGELLRIRSRPGSDVAAIRDALERLGFATEEVPGAGAARRRWFGVSSVGELSREEGAVIAARVVPRFGTASGLSGELVAALRARVGAALYECFVGQPDAALRPGALASSCGRAVALAAEPLIGADRAAGLARAIEADLAGR